MFKSSYLCTQIQNNMKVYLSLPISGHDEKERYTYAARTSAMLTAEHEGWEVINPFHVAGHVHKRKMEETGRLDRPTYEEYMRADIEALSNCQLAIFCPGWHTSDGCKEEMRECWWRGIEVIFMREDGQLFTLPPKPLHSPH